jgi:hypothetical protein
VLVLNRNYAPTIAIQAEAARQGCQQVLWLCGDQHLMTEVGTMNLFVLMDNEKGGKSGIGHRQVHQLIIFSSSAFDNYSLLLL